MIYVARNTLAAVKSKYIYTQPVIVSGNRFARRYGHWPAERARKPVDCGFRNSDPSAAAAAAAVDWR